MNDTRDGVRTFMATYSGLAAAALDVPDSDIIADPWVSWVWALRDADGNGWVVYLDIGDFEEVDFSTWPPNVL